MPDLIQRVYVAFQGGGARGLVHIGALRALENISFPSHDSAEDIRRPEIAGVAGTSAGAIMAALVAARYDSHQIISGAEGDPSNILQRLKRRKVTSLKDIFTTAGWLKIKIFSTMLSLIPIVAWTALLVAGVVAIVVGILWHQGHAFKISTISFAISWPRAVLCFLVLGLAFFCVKKALSHFVLRGLAPLTVVWDVIDEALVGASLAKSLDGKRGITFRELEEAGGRPLRIISTDVTSRGLRIFSREETPDVPIADAVCASICLPFIFDPHKITLDGKIHQFVDGGFLSNLPLWAFDNDRIADDSSWTIGFSLAPERRRAVKSLGDLGSAILDAVVSGPPEIHARGISSLMIIPIETSLKLLHFDKTLEIFKAEILSAQGQAADVMSRALSGPAVSLLVERFKVTLEKEFERLSGASSSISLKVALACQKFAGSSFWSRFLAGYSDDEEEQKRRVFFPALSDSAPFLSVNNNLHGRFLSSSKWGLVVPVNGPAGDSPASPLLLIECSTLTIEDMCAIYRVASIDELELRLQETVKSSLLSVDEDDAFFELIKGAQLWK